MKHLLYTMIEVAPGRKRPFNPELLAIVRRLTGWGDDDVLIACHRFIPGCDYDPPVTVLRCELCTAAVAAAPITAQESHKPGVHVVCRECYSRLLPGNEVKFKGRIRPGATELPK